MDLVELTKNILANLVMDKEALSVKEFPSEEENEIVIQVMVNEEDMGRVIGKAGKTANAVRTLVQASSYLQDNKRVRINIDHF